MEIGGTLKCKLKNYFSVYITKQTVNVLKDVKTPDMCSCSDSKNGKTNTDNPDDSDNDVLDYSDSSRDSDQKSDK